MGISTLEELKQLSVAERLLLVEDLWDSIEMDTPASAQLTGPQTAELARRLAAHQADPEAAIPWEQVRAKLFSRPGE